MPAPWDPGWCSADKNCIHRWGLLQPRLVELLAWGGRGQRGSKNPIIEPSLHKIIMHELPICIFQMLLQTVLSCCSRPYCAAAPDPTLLLQTLLSCCSRPYCAAAPDPTVLLLQTLLWWCSRPYCGDAPDPTVLMLQTLLCWCYRPYCGDAPDPTVLLLQTLLCWCYRPYCADATLVILNFLMHFDNI